MLKPELSFYNCEKEKNFLMWSMWALKIKIKLNVYSSIKNNDFYSDF